MAGNDDGAGAQRIRLAQSLEGIQRAQVITVGQQGAGHLGGHPAQLVHFTLIGQGESALGKLSGPVEDILGAAAHGVGGDSQRHAQGHLQSHFLTNLADCGFCEGLARVLLALGPGPVVVVGSVNDEHLEDIVAHAPNQRAGSNDFCGVGGGTVDAVHRVEASGRVVDGGGILRGHVSLVLGGWVCTARWKRRVPRLIVREKNHNLSP